MDGVKPLDRAAVPTLPDGRMSTRTGVAVVVAVFALLAVSACGTGDGEAASAASTAASASMEPDGPASGPSAEPSAERSTESSAPDDVVQPGAYIDLADYESDPSAYQSGAVVLFFAASWCPTCQSTVKSLDADGVPAGLTVVSVDYDAATDLKQQYGVTVQHTFVQVDEAGAELAKFTGSVSGEDIAGQTV